MKFFDQNADFIEICNFFLQEFYVQHDMILSDRIIEIPDTKQFSGTTT